MMTFEQSGSIRSRSRIITLWKSWLSSINAVSVMRVIVAWSFALIVSSISSLYVAAQATTMETDSFDVVSIRMNRSDNSNSKFVNESGRLDARNITVGMLLSAAFGVRTSYISGLPTWCNTERYDVAGIWSNAAFEKIRGLSEDEARPIKQKMLQSLLIERFHLKAHIAPKELPQYALAVGAHGLKLRPAAVSNVPDSTIPWDSRILGRIDMEYGRMTGRGVTLDRVAQQLTVIVQRTVINRTGLSGTFNFELKWRPDNAPAEDGMAVSESLFTALDDQLGLKLRPEKGLEDTLIIEIIDRPTDN